MPRPVPAPDNLSKPFWDACNEKRLIVQICTYCDRKQFPPQPACGDCGWDYHMSWLEVEGKGIIDGFGITYDTRIRAWAPDQPFNNAVIKLAQFPEIQFFSNLPGVPVGEVPVGANVEVDFIEVEGGQLIPEWKIVG